jgi:hypothetical protein
MSRWSLWRPWRCFEAPPLSSLPAGWQRLPNWPWVEPIPTIRPEAMRPENV